MSIAIERIKERREPTVETPRGERPGGGDESRPEGTSGGPGGTSGDPARRAFWIAYAIVAASVLGICTVNALTTLDDYARIGHPIAAWKPFLFEGTSAALIIGLAPLIHAVVQRFPPSRRRIGLFLAAHAVAAVAYSLLHVVGMIALRKLAFRLGGETYDFGTAAARWLYELRKDAFCYVAIAAGFWMVRRLIELQREASTAPEATPRPRPAAGTALLALRDGTRTLQVKPGDLLWAASAGNYVEIALADGSKPLIRGTLKSFEAILAPHGFVRVHRTRLVNPARIAAVEAKESGDLSLTLDDGSRLAGSRRYRAGIDQAVLAKPG